MLGIVNKKQKKREVLFAASQLKPKLNIISTGK